MQLLLMTSDDLRKYLVERRDIIIPIGSIEQHGPTGVLGIDAICAEVLGCGLGQRTGALVGPTIPVGMAQHHLGFAGSMSLRPSTLIAVIRDTVESLAYGGFERFYFINAHGTNVPIIKGAFAEIYSSRSFGLGAEPPEVKCRLRNWWELPSVRDLSIHLYGEEEGTHATPAEVALSHYAYDEAIRTAPLTPDPPRKRAYTHADDYRRKFPDGRVGSNPALVQQGHGKLFYDAALHTLVHEYQNWLRSH